MTSVHWSPAKRLRGTVAPPADKSISHRAAILGAMAAEPVRVRNYLHAEDTTSTLNAVRALGALVTVDEDVVTIRGTGLRNATEPGAPIDVGNAGTLMRLLPGWLAGPGGQVLHAGRRRVDPHAPDRPHRRAADADGRDDRRGRRSPGALHRARRPPALHRL